MLSLVNHSLLHRTPSGRYHIHELLRQFAAEKLTQSPADEAAVQARHSAYYCHFVRQKGADLKGRLQEEALSDLKIETENLRQAWEWAIGQKQTNLLSQAIDGLNYFYEWQGRYQEGERACRLAVEALTGLDSKSALRILAKTLCWQGRFSRLFGEGKQAAHLTEQALAHLDTLVLQDQDTRAERVAILLEIGEQASNLRKAERRYEQCLTLYQALEDWWSVAQTLKLHGELITPVGQVTKGRRFLEESLSLYQMLGDRRGQAQVLEILGFREMLYSNAEAGEKTPRRGMNIRREMEDKVAILRSLTYLVCGLSAQGKFNEAYPLTQEYRALSQLLGDRPTRASSYALQALIGLHLGCYQQAFDQLQTALELHQRSGSSADNSVWLWWLGEAILADGEYSTAELWLEQSIALHQTAGARARAHDVMPSLGIAYLRLNKLEAARRCLADSLQVALQNHSVITTSGSLALAALIALECSQPEQAVARFALASRFPRIANSCWYADVVGKPIEVAAAKLSPEVVMAAQTRGQTCDLWQTAAELLDELGQA